MSALKAECERQLSAKLTIDSVLPILQFADLNSAATLLENCLQFVGVHASAMIDAAAWEQFTAVARPQLVSEVLARMMTTMWNI